MKRPRIDKSCLMYGEPKRIRDKKYRDSAKDRSCMVCGSMGTTVLCHINIAGNFGRGLKASDDQSLFLCQGHHYAMDSSTDRADWILRNIFLPMRTRKYWDWKHARRT